MSENKKVNMEKSQKKYKKKWEFSFIFLIQPFLSYFFSYNFKITYFPPSGVACITVHRFSFVRCAHWCKGSSLWYKQH